MKYILFAFLVLVIGGGAYYFSLPVQAPQPEEETPTTETPEKSSIPEDTRITLERTACFGFCPVYTLSIDADGTVTYDGKRFVKVQGKQTATISSSDMERLLAAFDAANFFSLKERYEEPISDLPTITTSLTVNGKTKTVVDYAGAPQTLKDLEALIDELAQSKQWVGTCTSFDQDSCES